MREIINEINLAYQAQDVLIRMVEIVPLESAVFVNGRSRYKCLWAQSTG